MNPFDVPEAPRRFRRGQSESGPWDLPLTRMARRLRMEGRSPTEVAAKIFSLMNGGDQETIPSEGTPREPAGPPGATRGAPVISASRSIPDTAQAFTELVGSGRLIAPPYEPYNLVVCVDESEALPPAIDAMAVNIAGHGWELQPLFPTTDETTGEALEPPPEAKQERADLLLWLAALCPEDGITGLLDKCDRDIETIGWGVIEVLRDREGRVASLVHIPAYQVRLGPEDRAVKVDHVVRHPDTGELVTVTRWRRFRRFAQVKDGRVVWFRQFGDPRHVNWRTGEVKDVAWGTEDGSDLEATELIYVRRYHPATPYGVPLWIGGAPHARMGRAAAELIVEWFDNAPIGTKLLMLSGGVFEGDALESLQDQIDHAGRGRENAWNVLGIKAETDSASDPMEGTKDAPPRLALEDLNTPLPSELYHGRDSLIGQSGMRVQGMFRLARVYYGDSEGESNRAAADTGRAIGEEQVFGPLRRGRWENLFNGSLLPLLGFNLWRIAWKGATTSDDTDGLVAALDAMVTGGGASPNDLRRILAGLTGRPLKLIPEPWGERPLSITVALLGAGLDPNKPLSELAAEVEAKAEQARQDAKDAAEARANQGPPGGGGGGAPPRGGRPGVARKSAAEELGALADRLYGELDKLSGAEGEATGAAPRGRAPRLSDSPE